MTDSDTPALDNEELADMAVGLFTSIAAAGEVKVPKELKDKKFWLRPENLSYLREQDRAFAAYVELNAKSPKISTMVVEGVAMDLESQYEERKGAPIGEKANYAIKQFAYYMQPQSLADMGFVAGNVHMKKHAGKTGDEIRELEAEERDRNRTRSGQVFKYDPTYNPGPQRIKKRSPSSNHSFELRTGSRGRSGPVNGSTEQSSVSDDSITPDKPPERSR